MYPCSFAQIILPLLVDTRRVRKVTSKRVFCSFVFKGVFMPARLLTIAVLFLFSFVAASGQTSRALLIAIDKYPDQSGWNEIHATNDLKLLKPMLSEQGFPKENIAVLTNARATKAAIVKNLKQLAANSRTGDHIYIHFSCHGQQMADNDGDEEDGLDEALIPYDAQRRYSNGVYEGDYHLRDDELGLLLDAIRLKAGGKGSVILTLDACHSGTGDRVYDTGTYVRGTTYIFAPPDFVRPEGDGKPFIGEIKSAPNMATLTVIAACHPDELNYEYRSPSSGNYYGSLTFALCHIWRTKKPSSVEALRIALREQMIKLKPRRGKIQTPLLQTSDEKKVFRIGL